MKYAIKVIDTITDFSNYNAWHKTNRGWEAWCDSGKTYTDLNSVYKVAGRCNIEPPSGTYYIVEEVQ